MRRGGMYQHSVSMLMWLSSHPGSSHITQFYFMANNFVPIGSMIEYFLSNQLELSTLYFL